MPSTKRRRKTGKPTNRGAAAQQSARAAEARLAQQRADRRRQRWVLAAVVIGLAVVVTVASIGYRFWQTHRSPDAPSAQPTFPAVSVTDGKPIVLGAEDAAVTVTLYEDFRCPHCADFTEELGPTLTGLQRDGTVKLEVYPMSFVDPKHGSVSSANALACAAAAGRGQQYYAGLFENYGLPWSEDQLVELGALSGVGKPDFGDCVRSMQYRGWVDSITRVAEENNVQETPTVLIDGTVKPKAAEWTPAQLRDQIQAAQ